MTLDTGRFTRRINYDDPDPACALPGISTQAQERPVTVALLNAFGSAATMRGGLKKFFALEEPHASQQGHCPFRTIRHASRPLSSSVTSKIKPTTRCGTTGLDSMATIELLYQIEDAFDVADSDQDLAKLTTVANVTVYIEGSGARPAGGGQSAVPRPNRRKRVAGMPPARTDGRTRAEHRSGR